MKKTKWSMANVSATFALVAGAIALAACQPTTVRPPSTVTATTPQIDTSGAIPYKVDSEASALHILVYRAGAMARLGHNHVVSSRNVSRAIEGEDFKQEIPDDAREGTRKNLLGLDVLDAANFPTITLQSVAITGSRDTPSLLMRITIKGVSRDVVTIARVHEQGSRLTAEGEFAIQQTEFGITPLSVGMGALQVQDRLQIRFKIVANRS
jgi:polyisoprenoid-binding protein YceI